MKPDPESDFGDWTLHINRDPRRSRPSMTELTRNIEPKDGDGEQSGAGGVNPRKWDDIDGNGGSRNGDNTTGDDTTASGDDTTGDNNTGDDTEGSDTGIRIAFEGVNELPEEERDEELDGDEWISRADILHVITQPTRRNLLVAILVHPRQMPSRAELAFMSPDISKNSESTIYRHMRELSRTGIVEEVEISEDRQANDLPHKFYKISHVGEEFLNKHGLIPERLDGLRELYASREKPERIQRYEKAPRPGDPPVDTGDIDPGILSEVLKELKETGNAEAAAEKLIRHSENHETGNQPDSGGENDHWQGGEISNDTEEADSQAPTAQAQLAKLIH